jgi:hypothetical protein
MLSPRAASVEIGKIIATGGRPAKKFREKSQPRRRQPPTIEAKGIAMGQSGRSALSDTKVSIPLVLHIATDRSFSPSDLRNVARYISLDWCGNTRSSHGTEPCGESRDGGEPNGRLGSSAVKIATSTLLAFFSLLAAVLVLASPIRAACTQVCTTTADCGAITYEQRCVNGQCFNFPRQHCVPRQVCQNVCK